MGAIRIATIGSAIGCLLLLAVGAAQEARADGCHFPPPAYGRPASVPMQRALVAFRDGQETLIVESAFATEAKEVGWIIPLPAVPEKILPVSSGALKTLAFCLQPVVIHYVPDPLKALAWLVFIATFFFLYVALKPKEQRRATLLEMLAVVGLLAIVAGMLLPALSRTRGGGAEGAALLPVRVEKLAQVGSYEVAILRAEKAEALNEWLQQNGFMPLPQRGAPIAADYIARGWCFAAARLQRNESGVSLPHPIRFDFRTSQPVYPMRLTALAGAPPALDLYVAAQEPATAPGLEVVFRDRLQARSYEPYVRTTPEGSDARIGDRLWTFTGSATHRVFSHADLAPALWDGAVLTRLTGTLKPEAMADDIRIHLDRTDSGPVQQYRFSRRGALMIGGLSAAVLLAPFLSIAPFAMASAIRARGRRWFVTRVCAPVVGAVLAAGALFYLAVPKINVHADRQYGRHGSYVLRDMLAARRFSAETPRADVVRALTESLAGLEPRRTRNPFFGGSVIVEASPGNYDVRLVQGVWYLITFARDGEEEWWQVSAAAEKP